jgi:branched-chain amino acid transport system substrate-binding protein
MKIKAVIAAAALSVFVVSGAQAQISVKLGVLNDMSGLYADISGPGSVVAANLAVEDYMKIDKSIAVEIVSADHQNKPDIGVNIARQWYERDNVDVILDVTTSSVALAVSELTREKKKLFLASGAGSSDLTGVKCSPYTVHWTYDTWALANGTGSALTKKGADTWFLLTADYAFGAALERDTVEAVTKAGGKVVGSVKHPMNSSDFSSFLLTAQASKAKVVALANAGSDMINAIKQAAEFGITQGGQSLAGLLIFSSDVKALGLQAAQGLMLTEAFYWDQTDATREFSKRFAAKFNGKVPTMAQAGVYSSILHYLKAVSALKSKDSDQVMAKMKETPIDDALFGKGAIRADGRAIHPMYLYQVKKPAESNSEWDIYKLVATIPAEEAFRPLNAGGCPLVSQK